MVENSIYICGGLGEQSKQLESIERLRISDDAGYVEGWSWETLKISTPKFE